MPANWIKDYTVRTDFLSILESWKDWRKLKKPPKQQNNTKTKKQTKKTQNKQTNQNKPTHWQTISVITLTRQPQTSCAVVYKGQQIAQQG